MTEYCGVFNGPLRQIQSKRKAAYVKVADTSIFGLNLILLLMAAITIVTYIFISNLLVAQRYALNLRKSELNQLNAALATEEQYDRNDNLKTLLRFARNYGLVEAKDTDLILEKNNFATLP